MVDTDPWKEGDNNIWTQVLHLFQNNFLRSGMDLVNKVTLIRRKKKNIKILVISHFKEFEIMTDISLGPNSNSNNPDSGIKHMSDIISTLLTK